MKVLDGVAIALVVSAALSFAAGGGALAHAEDLKALYWLVVGIVAVRGAVHISRPRGA
jgi:hypothetical protein